MGKDEDKLVDLGFVMNTNLEAIRNAITALTDTIHAGRQEASKDVKIEQTITPTNVSAEDVRDSIMSTNTRRRAQYGMSRSPRPPREPLNVPYHIQLVLQETKHDFRRQLLGYTRTESTKERCELCDLTLNNPVHLIEEA